jgi:uncharacterized protein
VFCSPDTKVPKRMDALSSKRLNIVGSKVPVGAKPTQTTGGKVVSEKPSVQTDQVEVFRSEGKGPDSSILLKSSQQSAESTAFSSSGSWFGAILRFLQPGKASSGDKKAEKVVDRAPTTLATLDPQRSKEDQKFLDKYGPWALVTGASSGIGAAMAEELASKGMNVVVTARRGEKLNHLSEELSAKYGVEARPVSCDLTSPDFMRKLEQDTKNLEVGLLVNNAGAWEFGSFLENDLDKELRVLDLNAKAPLMLSHHFGKKMVARGKGGMVFVSSGAAYAGLANQANYSGSKAYGLNLAESLNQELKGKGVDVLAVTPGPVTTQGAADAHVDFGKLPPTMAPVSAEQVARESFSKLGKKVSHIPGALSRMSMAVSLRVLGRNLHSSVASYFFGKALGQQ